jgi:hypothetical protein
MHRSLLIPLSRCCFETKSLIRQYTASYSHSTSLVQQISNEWNRWYASIRWLEPCFVLSISEPTPDCSSSAHRVLFRSLCWEANNARPTAVCRPIARVLRSLRMGGRSPSRQTTGCSWCWIDAPCSKETATNSCSLQIADHGLCDLHSSAAHDLAPLAGYYDEIGIGKAMAFWWVVQIGILPELHRCCCP